MSDQEKPVDPRIIRGDIEANRRTSRVRTEDMDSQAAEAQWRKAMQEPWALACQNVLGLNHSLFKVGDIVTTGKTHSDGGYDVFQSSKDGIHRSIKVFGTEGPEGIAASVSTIAGPVLTDFYVLKKGQIIGEAVGGLTTHFTIDFPPKVGQ